MLPAMIKLDEIYQSREFKSLDDIFANDNTGLLDNIEPATKRTSANNLLEQQFLNINAFVDTHGHPPRSDASDINEKILARQLTAIQENVGMVRELMSLDNHGLLSDNSEPDNGTPHLETTEKQDDTTPINNENLEPSAISNTDTSNSNPKSVKNPNDSPLSISSLDDIFDNDDLGLFDDITSDILISDSKTNGRTRSNPYEEEEIATRFECVDFYKFEPIFDRIYHAIQTGAFTKASSTSFKSITIGSVFVLNGLLCYVADIYKAEARKDARSQERLRLIFANGTESNMLTHSLATAQYKYENSYQILITDPDWMDDELARNYGDKKHLSGVIYVAKLIDTPDNLKHYKHLHKIGFSTLTGEMRAKHSLKDTAFLQQPVDIIAEWQIYDANARSVESVLHAFFYDQRVKMSTKAADEKLYRATEWFNVPLSEIEKAIGLVISGEIKNYFMDSAAGKIVPK